LMTPPLELIDSWARNEAIWDTDSLTHSKEFDALLMSLILSFGLFWFFGVMVLNMMF